MKDIMNNIKNKISDIYKNRMFVKSFVVGCVCAALQLSLLFVFTDVLSFNYWVSANISFIFTFFANFFLQKYWTFFEQTVGRVHLQMFKFFLNSLLNLIVNGAFMYLFVSIFGVWYLLSQAIITIMLFLFNFIMYKYFIFI